MRFVGCVMNPVSYYYRSRTVRAIALAGAAVALLGGCASDSTRLSDPFGNPFQTASRDVDHAPTGAVPEDMPARSAGVYSAPIQSSALPPPASPAPQGFGMAPRPSAPQPMPQPQRAAEAPHGATSGNWTAQGGTPVVVGYGETASMLAGRYGVPEDALLRVNGFKSAAQVQKGTRLIIPAYSTAAASAHAAPAAAPPRRAAAQPKAVFVKGPTGKVAQVKPAAPVKASPAAKPTAQATKLEAVKTAKVEAKPTKAEQAAVRPQKAAIDPQPTASLPKAEPAVATAEANPEFRWPARGRIIQGFKSGGNDGINIAVPEGTAVKAAENGVVAYAGSELKGYGNLVLIRHPNGFVSAYANNGEIDVKRGDTVKRGQTIAKSGQSGNVATPQLHFELRKGSTPVDPTGYLAGL
ncbi:MAG: hypothetical protein NVS2B5_24950 [Beijerinckiaceae bacterium]